MEMEILRAGTDITEELAEKLSRLDRQDRLLLAAAVQPSRHESA